RPRCNILGPSALGFRHRDDVTEISRLLDQIGIDVAIVAPLNATPADLAALINADFNVLLYPETGYTTAAWLEREFGMKFTRTVPIGVNATHEFIREVCDIARIDPPSSAASSLRARWYARSVDSTYLTGKRVFIFGDATHAIAAARIAAEEMGFAVVGLGTYSREFAREIREAAKRYGVEPLITDDYLEVEQQIMELQPELVLGSQMERHIAKRLSIPCAVISAPIHVQDFPARYSPQMGFEGANVMFDTWIHPLMMGLEEHLIHMFREDFEFHDGAAPSHLGHAVTAATAEPMTAARPAQQTSVQDVGATLVPELAEVAGASGSGLIAAESTWAAEALQELNKIPFFVRGKARRNTERFAVERGVNPITVETLYDAKAHFSR
ncbi:MAG: ferredoxin:protochlorophyllide reductase (ATP-dependent) subunit B, partial [Betaproteobacteria bacterium]|nr:ferredoxin:protochlorophyllide reductase (ATP-dependent) subunit B [Betaproteobacteria bacterium]